jgi:hypothetical protein
MVLEITFGPNLRALLAGELPPNLDSGFEVPTSRRKSGENPRARNHQAEDPSQYGRGVPDANR